MRVLDDGPGFPIEERDRLFELFYRSARTADHGRWGRHRPVRLCAPGGGDGRPDLGRARPGGGAEFGFALPELSE